MRSFIATILALTVIGSVPSPAEANPRSAHLTSRALDAMDAGNPEDALSLLEQALSVDAANGEAYFHQGRVLLELDRHEEALSAFEEASRMGLPTDFERGVALYRLQRYRDADTILRRVVAEAPEDTEAAFFLGMTLYRQNQYHDAAQYLSQAAENDRLRPDALYMKGLALLRTGDRGQARDALAGAAEAEGTPAGEQARALLAELEPSVKAYRVRVTALHQTDTNVLLVQTDQTAAEQFFTPDEISNRTGNRWVLMLDGEYRQPVGDRFSLTGGYSGYQSYHRTHRENLQRLDVSSHTLRLRGSYSKDQWSVVVPVFATISMLGPLTNPVGEDAPDLSLYSRSIGGSLMGVYALTKSHILTGGYTLTGENFAEEGVAVQANDQTITLDRDNVRHTLQTRYLWSYAEGAYLSAGLSGFVSQARGEDNAWDHLGGRASLSATSPKWGTVLPTYLMVSGGAAARNYATPYPVATDDDFTAEDRSDTEMTSGLQLRSEWGVLRGQAGVYWQRNLSTVSAFDYSRMIYTLGIGAEL